MVGDEDRNFDDEDELIWSALYFVQRMGHTEMGEDSDTAKIRS